MLGRRLHAGIAFIGAAALSSGCASIATGGTQTLNIDSDPPGAAVVFQGGQLGQTPTQIEVPRRRAGVQVVIKKDGYHDATVRPSNTMSGWVIGNVILGGLIGTTVDVATGSSVEYSPDSYYVTLTPEQAQDHSGSPFHRPVSNRTDVKSYLLVAFEPIIDDILIGNGRHLDTLLSRLSVPESDREQAIGKLQSILTLSEGDAMTFADMVLHHFPVDAPMAPKNVPQSTPAPPEESKDFWGRDVPQASFVPTPTAKPRYGDNFRPTPTPQPKTYF